MIGKNSDGVCQQINIFSQCKKYDLPLWQCPQFLFLIMGMFIIVATLTTYALGTKYVNNPQVVVLIILLITAILFIISFVIIQSFERLAEANRMKTDFINIVSHQLRSPLTNIRWTTDLLTSGELEKSEEKQTEFFTILKENIIRMEELVSDLLIVSRMESEKMLSKKTLFSVEKVTKDLIVKAGPFAKSHNAEVTLEAGKEPSSIFGNLTEAELVVENLLDNAIKYIKGNGKIKIKIIPKKKYIYFEIKDNGVGIPRDDQKYIFQKFFRSRNAKQTQTHGSGLGLYICKTAIEKNGGKIGFYSEENKGSKFWFTLPIK